MIAGDSETIRSLAREAGFQAVGITTVDDRTRWDPALRQFLARGYHGEMAWMAETAARRAGPRALWPEARSVIALGASYTPETDPLEDLGRRDRAVISVYARGRDYHDVLKRRLKRMARAITARWPCAVKVFVDTAPVMEKPLAVRAGLGWQGKHTNLVSRSHGSWLFLGEIFTDLALPPDDPEADHCGRCTRCLDICPTDAFPAPYRLDARRCLSYLTIEHKGPIPHGFRVALGNRVYGCDDCLAVCPWNKFAETASIAHLRAREDLNGPRLTDLARLDDAAFRDLFAGSPIKRTGRDRFVRNVAIALGNSDDPEARRAAEALLTDGAPLVRGAAVWACARLFDLAHVRVLADRHAASETDPDVRREWALARAGVVPTAGRPPRPGDRSN